MRMGFVGVTEHSDAYCEPSVCGQAETGRRNSDQEDTGLRERR